ncbi:MAG: hypothetical protein H8E59_04375 [Actinobacteria bacterium]|nr:hypothetical protein [Actinomycetota bacterium]
MAETGTPSHDPHDEEPRDLASRVTDHIVDAVGALRSRTTEPLLTATRAIVYGTFVAIAGTAFLALVGIGLFRLLDTALPGESWSAFLALGAACIAAGAWLWSRRTPTTD